MKPAFLSNSIRKILGTRGYAIGLLTILSTIQGISIVQTAQAQAIPAGKPGSVCSDAYFKNPDFMYGVRSKKQEELAAKFGMNPVRMNRQKRIWAKSNTFSVALDAPVGYVIKKVNGKAVAIPPKIAKDIDRDAFNANRDPQATRRKVAELNQKYDRYATFGQQLNLIFSPAQIKENTKMGRESSAYIASILTPQQKQAEQNAIRAAAKQMGMCPALFNPDSMRYVTIQVGSRPDLDKRLREDTTGATFFK
jgi:hypothetical protein